uniref:glycosyl hydrolase family 18 protein n=1 Tax=Pedobacter schmidteae TaxID=2201271 RepID=UPI000EAC5833|nr:glycosyl hydrolase family 18 protein [Pedobacter schmidteae]
MKSLTIKYIITAVLLLICFTGCKKGQDADYDDNFHPRIVDNNGVFTSPNRIIFQGQSAIYTGLTFSPKPVEKTKISWKVNGTQVSTDTAFTFTPTAGGEYEVKVEATYNGQTSTRISKILVSPTTFTPKPYTNVAMSYLTENATVANVDFATVTHIAYTGARVTPSGAVDFSKGNLNQNLDEIIARSHINGVPVLLGVTGTLSGIDGWSLYGSMDFASVIVDPAKRAALATAISQYVIARKLDGIDILMTDLGSDITTPAMQAIGPLLTLLRTALPTQILTVTVTTNYLHWDYPVADFSKANWVNVHAFEDGVHVGPGAPRGQASSLNFMISGAGIWANKMAKNKIVLGIPAFGLHYTAIDGQGNNLGWGSYDYMTYKSILEKKPDAYNNEYANIDFGVYYNGIPLIDSKTAYIKNNGFKGAYLYAGDYDVKGANSLMGAIAKTLK